MPVPKKTELQQASDDDRAAFVQHFKRVVKAADDLKVSVESLGELRSAWGETLDTDLAAAAERHKRGMEALQAAFDRKHAALAERQSFEEEKVANAISARKRKAAEAFLHESDEVPISSKRLRTMKEEAAKVEERIAIEVAKATEQQEAQLTSRHTATLRDLQQKHTEEMSEYKIKAKTLEAELTSVRTLANEYKEQLKEQQATNVELTKSLAAAAASRNSVSLRS